MASRIWLGMILIAALAVLGWRLVAQHSHPLPLRSLHSEPAAVMPSGPVIVSAEGKTFHRAECTFIHGPRQVIDARAAVRQGYAPCVRCEKDLLKRKGR
jgi:hypothetical protein